MHLPSDDTSAVNEDRPYTREEIDQVLQNGCNSDLRNKVVILLLCGSGLRRGAIFSLRIENLIPMEYKDLSVYKVLVYAGTRDKYFSYTTVESTKAIKDYLNYRQRYGEKLTDKSPLIREQFNIGDHLCVKNPRFVADKTIEYLIDQVVRRSGVRKPGVVHMSHGFRKFFISQCESSPMKSLDVSMLSGHTTGIKKHYYKPKDSDVLEDFMINAHDALTIDDNQRLKQENADLRKGQDNYLAELGELKEEFNEMKQWLVGLQKGNQKQLVKDFYKMTGNKVQDEWYESDDYKQWQRSKHHQDQD